MARQDKVPAAKATTEPGRSLPRPNLHVLTPMGAGVEFTEDEALVTMVGPFDVYQFVLPLDKWGELRAETPGTQAARAAAESDTDILVATPQIILPD